MSDSQGISRRDLLKAGGTTAAGLALLPSTAMAKLFQVGEGERLVSWLEPDEQAPVPGMNLLSWKDINSWTTPVDQFFKANHYNVPEVDGENYELEITGAVRQSLELPLELIKRRPKQNIDVTMECSGNRGFSWFKGGVYNATWTGTPLASILEEAGILRSGVEIVFFGHDEGEEEIQPRRGEKLKMKQNFARNLTIPQAMNPNILLCYEVNGQTIPKDHGFPLRLITPG
ncbi:MAG: molybdopterin-dependent oxidoreductase, partial [Candidatus Latescibacteria bacterium]|nr:molybdopterin-dependent oxidoreductase [Candidatus Latescibacterota bacterium]